MATRVPIKTKPPLFVCCHCGRHLSSKQRLQTHSNINHKGSPNKGSSFRCSMCGKSLSSNRNLQQHLNRIHGKSPVKSVYKAYHNDPTVPIPKTTVLRHQSKIVKNLKTVDLQHSCGITEEALEEIESISEHSESDSEPLHEIPNETVVGNEYKSVDTKSADTSSSSIGHKSESKNDCEDLIMDFESELMTDDESDIMTDGESDTMTDGESDTMTDGVSEFIESYENASNSGSVSSDEDDWNDILELKNTSKKSLTKSQTIDMCMKAYAKRFNLSVEASKYLKELVSVVCPEIAPIQTVSIQEDFQSFHYCVKCNELFPPDPDVYECRTANCNTLRYEGLPADQMKSKRKPRSSFLIANLSEQLINLLERPGIWHSIEKVKYIALYNQMESNIHDIVDGDGYKNLCKPGHFLNNKTHLSAVINTDGIPLYSSSKVKLWPVFLALNEIPPAQRFSRDNILIAGIWQGKGNPPFQQYIGSLANEIHKLYADGINVAPPNCQDINVKVCVICATLDLQAKAYAANMTMHNGECGCSTCEEPGLVVKKGNGHVRSYPYRCAAERLAQRNSEVVKADAQQATRNRRIKGVCGISGLSILPEFDMVYGLVPDYMHGVLLGVTKAFMTLWFSPSNSDKAFFVGNKLNQISERLNKMTPPDCIERLPRDIEKHYGHLKATELQTWLLFYCIPCMYGILPDKYLEHFSLLSEGTFLLLGDNITSQELQRASFLLDRFYQQCEELYGCGVSGLNVHNVGVHLVDFVKLWGPLWCWSCFPFEDANAAILKAVHGTGDVTKQYLNFKQSEMKLNKMAHEAISVIRVSDKKAKNFLKNMLKSGKYWNSTKSMEKCRTAGKLSVIPLSECNEDLLYTTQSAEASDVKKCLRVELNGQRYYSQEYSRMKKRTCHFVICQSGEVVSVKFFVVNSEMHVFAVVQKYNISADCCIFRSSGKHIVKIVPTEHVKTIPVTLIMDKLFYIAVQGTMYVVRLPNQLGRSVFK